MLDLVKSAQTIMETCVKVKPGTKVLVLVDDQAFPERYGRILMDVATSLGGDAVMAITKKRANRVDELPAAIAAAMKSVDQIVYVSNNLGLGRTRAYQEAYEAGAQCRMASGVPEDYYAKADISIADLELIGARTKSMAQKLTDASQARVTTPAGTDITFSLQGRKALTTHPLDNMGGLPDSAESSIAPLEGTAEGVIIADKTIACWGYMLDAPIRLVFKGGRAVEITGGRDAEKLRRLAATDENASNFAELGVGASHTLSQELKGDAREICQLGTIHLAIGQNVNHLGGATRSKIHEDMLITEPTLYLDGKVVIKDGVWIE